ncbi:MAG: ThuA domain-containing protein [Planctomyces sp.]|nr:ThuA domain-containing protein [Planctomyces sp.]
MRIELITGMLRKLLPAAVFALTLAGLSFPSGGATSTATAAESNGTLVFEPASGSTSAKHIVFIAGDEEYRSEESMPMLAKILSGKHGFRCSVVFSMGPDGADYIDPNNQQGLRGLQALESADLMIIGTRFRHPSPEQAAFVTAYLNSGKPVIGIRTATHAFQGGEKFGDNLTYGEFGLKILGEQWVSHHGNHKVEGARGVIVPGAESHPVLNSVKDVFAPSDVYGVVNLTDKDQILLRGAITKTLDPESEILKDKRNDPMQPFAWLHTYSSPDGKCEGRSFCTTAGAAVDFVSEDLRRLIVNAAYFLTDQDVPQKADVDYVDPFFPSFYGFIGDKSYWKGHNLKPEDFGPGKSPVLPDAPGSPEWKFRPMPPQGR